MNKTFKKIFSVCSAVVTTLTATLFHSTNLKAEGQKQQIVFVGPEQAGKTKLVSRICENSYNSAYSPTRGATFSLSPRQTWWDLSGNPKYSDMIACYFRNNDLCVLSMSNTNQTIENFLNILARNDVSNVVLCITKTDEDVPDSAAVSKLLGRIKKELPKAKVFDEVLYTSAQKNTFKFCKPDEYTASNGSHIYNDETKEKVLADKLYELCERKAEDSRDDIYKQPESFGDSGCEARSQNGTSEPTYSFKIGQSSSTAKLPTSKTKKYALGLGIPAGLLTLIFGTAYYEYDRHFRKQEKTRTKTKSEKTSKVDRTISS